MTQQDLLTATPQTYRDAVAHFFQSHPGQWIDGLQIAGIGGAYAWRSRVSDCRVELHMLIENRKRRDGQRVISEYRYQPAEARD